MNQRLILLIGIFSIYGMNISNAGIVQDLETANKIPDEQWIEKSKAFVTAPLFKSPKTNKLFIVRPSNI